MSGRSEAEAPQEPAERPRRRGQERSEANSGVRNVICEASGLRGGLVACGHDVRRLRVDVAGYPRSRCPAGDPGRRSRADLSDAGLRTLRTLLYLLAARANSRCLWDTIFVRCCVQAETDANVSACARTHSLRRMVPVLTCPAHPQRVMVAKAADTASSGGSVEKSIFIKATPEECFRVATAYEV